jgi:hypothetical protein
MVMKNLALTFVMLAFAVCGFAQISATTTANATATIITPLAIAKVTDMDFGTFTNGNGSGSFILNPLPVATRTGVVGVVLFGGTVSAASFTVTGEGASAFSITLPAAALSLASGANDPLTISAWTSSPSLSGNLTAGTANILVGATLTTGAASGAGVYAGPTFDVTVNYN